MTKRMLDGDITRCPKISSCYVDVRDVADLHILAMTNPVAKGQRFLAVADNKSFSMLDLAKILRKNFGEAAYRVPTKEIPSWLLKIAAKRNPTLQAVVPLLGQYMDCIGEKAKRLLDWSPRSVEKSITDTAESLLRLGLIKKTDK